MHADVMIVFSVWLFLFLLIWSFMTAAKRLNELHDRGSIDHMARIMRDEWNRGLDDRSDT